MPGRAGQAGQAIRVDPFWRIPVAAYPRVPERCFWTRPRPPAGLFLKRWSRSPLRLGLVHFGIGFLSVFVAQAYFFFQLVLGAPIFEESVKFGLALMLTAWAVRTRTLRPFLLLVAWCVGAAFGWFEHWWGYNQEGFVQMLWRIAFHGGSTLLSATLLTVLWSVEDTRARWLATLPSVLFHYLNNAGLVFLASLDLLFPVAPVIEVLPYAVIMGLYVGVLTLTVAGRPVRRLARRWVRERLEPLAGGWQAEALARGPRTAPTGR